MRSRARQNRHKLTEADKLYRLVRCRRLVKKLRRGIRFRIVTDVAKNEKLLKLAMLPHQYMKVNLRGCYLKHATGATPAVVPTEHGESDAAVGA